MTETATQPNQNDQLYNQAGVPNRVVPKVKVRMLGKDLDDFEKELETSRLAAENADKQATHDYAHTQPSVPQGNSENPNSAKQPEQPNTDWQKRYSDLQSHADKKVAEANKKLAEQEKENTELKKQLQAQAQQKKAYPVSEQDLEQWVKEFPPLLPIIQTIAMKAFDERSDEIRTKFSEVENTAKELASEKARTDLLKIHPDANEIETDPRFAQWFNEQESEIQQLIASKNTKKIAKAISMYKKDLGIVTKTVQDLQKEASMAINVGPTPPDLPKEQKVWYESEVAKMSNKVYPKFQAEIEKARREGRFVYDISRAS